MRTFLLVYFWLMTTVLILQLMRMMTSDYPRTPAPVKLGVDTVEAILHLAFMGWVAWLLWGGGAQ